MTILSSANSNDGIRGARVGEAQFRPAVSLFCILAAVFLYAHLLQIPVTNENEFGEIILMKRIGTEKIILAILQGLIAAALIGLVALLSGKIDFV